MKTTIEILLKIVIEKLKNQDETFRENGDKNLKNRG